MAGGGEEKAVFEGLKNDAEQYLPQAASKAAGFAEATAEGVDRNVAAHMEQDAQLGRDFQQMAERPPQAPAVTDPAPAVGGGTSGSGAAGVLSDKDVPAAGIEATGVSGAESGPTDPVDLVSGQLLESVIDFSLPGVLPLVLRRTYASGYPHGGLLGPGWSSTLDIRLVVDERGRVRFLGDDAQCLDYQIPSGTALGLPSYPDYGARWALARDPGDGAWTVANPQTGLTYRFAAEGRFRPLLAIRDRSGNEIRIRRDEHGYPLLIEHSGGYRVRVELAEAAGTVRISGYMLETGQDARSQQLVGFGYDGSGRLAAVTDSTGAAHCYEYDGHDRITAWIDRSGYRYPYRYDPAGRVIETGEPGGFKHAVISYDLARRSTSVTDGLGHTSVYHYNRFQQITKITDPYGAQSTLRKDAYGRLLEHVTPLGHTTVFGYDRDGNRTKITYPDGQSVTMAYHGPGLVARIDLPDGACWRYAYDERGNAVSETDPLGALSRFDYDEHGAVTAITDPLGASWRYELNPAGLPVAAIDPAGSHTEITRDHQGRITALRAPDGARTWFERDGEGRVTAQTGPDGAVTRYGYDEAGNQTLTTDPSGRTTRIVYGPFYTPVARVNPDGSGCAFAYDAELRLTTVTGPTGLTWAYSYDGNGQRTGERDFDGREQAYAFDADGQLIEHTAADGQATVYRRDAAGRALEVRAGAEGARFGYDRIGRLVSAVNRHATVLITRDLLGRTVREEINGRATTRAYDAVGNLAERTTPAGRTSTWTYDALGEAASLTTGTDTLAFTRDLLGREIRRETGAFALTQGYDAAGQLTAQKLTGATGVIQARAYSYDADGLPVRVSDLLRGTRVMDLDPLGRITAVHHGDQAERYAYDPVGNLAASQIPQLPAGTEHAAATGTHTVAGTRTQRAGRTEYTYDQRGRLAGKTRRTLSGTKLTWTYRWDNRDRLAEVTRPDGHRWTYRYDALGRRVDKMRLDAEGNVAENTVFSWDGTLLVEQAAGGPDTPAATVTWDYEPGGYRPAAQRRTTEPATATDGVAGPGSLPGAGGQERIDAEFWTIVTDLTGTPQELIDRDGRIAWTQLSSLWGIRPDLQAAEPGAVECPLGFPGQYHDTETGLAYNDQRYYDPDTGGYLSPDPVGLNAAPHPRRYVPNPLAAADPLGLIPQAPAVRMKTDDELQADADAIHEGFRTYYTAKTGPEAGNMAYDKATVSTFQGEDGGLHYSVNRSKSYPGMDDFAKKLGYTRVSGTKYMATGQTDAEQIMLNAVDKDAVPDAGRIATSRIPCEAFRRNGNPAQNCAGRIASYAGIRLVGRFARRQ